MSRGGNAFAAILSSLRNFLTLTDRQVKEKEGVARERGIETDKSGGPFFSQESDRRYPLSFAFEFHEASQRWGYKHLRCGLSLEPCSTHPDTNQTDKKDMQTHKTDR